MEIQSPPFQSHLIQPSKNQTTKADEDSNTNNSQAKNNTVSQHPTISIERLSQKLTNDSNVEQAERIAEIKAKVAAGTFEIDTTKIADRFLEQERMLLL